MFESKLGMVGSRANKGGGISYTRRVLDFVTATSNGGPPKLSSGHHLIAIIVSSLIVVVPIGSFSCGKARGTGTKLMSRRRSGESGVITPSLFLQKTELSSSHCVEYVDIHPSLRQNNDIDLPLGSISALRRLDSYSIEVSINDDFSRLFCKEHTADKASTFRIGLPSSIAPNSSSPQRGKSINTT